VEVNQSQQMIPRFGYVAYVAVNANSVIASHVVAVAVQRATQDLSSIIRSLRGEYSNRLDSCC
jgi:hypothetical protein